MHSTSRTIRSLLVMYGGALLVAVAGFAIATRFVGPPPPRTFRLAAGACDGAYYAAAHRYAAFMAQRGVHVEVLATAGTVENLRLLQQEAGGADVAFVQGGVADAAAAPGLVGLGSVGFEPCWVFARADDPAVRLADFKGRSLAIGPEGSGTRPLALKLLAANDINAGTARLEPWSGTNAVAALLGRQVDAVMLVAAVDAASVQALLLDGRVRALDFDCAEAYARRFHFLSAVRLPQGVVDLGLNRPPAPVRLVSPAATLVARADFHPALAGLLLQAASAAHGGGGLLSDPGQFPSPLYLDFPLSRDAERYFKYGPPFLQRFMPFWVATTIDRIKVMVVPLLVLLLPMIKIVPPAFRWRMRRKITRWYRQLSTLDASVDGAGAAELADLAREIDTVEQEVMRVSVPLGFADQLYNLRSHIDLVRGRITVHERKLAKELGN